MPDAYCRSCHATYDRPLPAPYGAICPDCMGRGEIVTLTDIPRHRGGRGRSGEDRASRGGPRSEWERASR